MKKTLLIFALILTILITFFSAYDVRGVEDLSYVIALGIDKSDSKDEPYSLTIQTAKPDSSESGGTKIKTDIQTVDCNSFNLGLSMLNLENEKTLNLSHCTAIIISEDLAKDGIENIINTITNNIEIRPTCNILISKEKTSEFLEVASNIEDISSKFYNSFINSAKTTSYITTCEFSKFYSNLNYDIQEPVALYSYIKDDSIETLGLAVFKDYKMIGRLSGLETICYNLLTNNFEQATIEVYNYQNPGLPITINIEKSNNTKIKVKLEDNIPKIECNVSVESKILTANKNYDFSTQESLKQLEAEINLFLEKSISDFLYKTSTEYNSDIIGFEGYFKKNFLTQDEIDKYNWQELYKNSEFTVKAQNQLISGFLFSKN